MVGFCLALSRKTPAIAGKGSHVTIYFFLSIRLLREAMRLNEHSMRLFPGSMRLVCDSMRILKIPNKILIKNPVNFAGKDYFDS